MGDTHGDRPQSRKPLRSGGGAPSLPPEPREQGRNPIRFYEYAFSSSVMIVVIALLVGIYELGALIALFGVNAAMNLFGEPMYIVLSLTAKTVLAWIIF